VLADVKQSRLTDNPVPRVFTFGPANRFVLRTAGEPEAVAPSIRTALAEIDPKIVVIGTTTMEAALADVMAAERFRAMLSTAFACTALLLAAVGLHSIAARRVADRRREFGIRIALGARPENLRDLVLRDAGVTVVLGLAAGLPAAFAASQATRAFLFGVRPAAPHILLGTATVLAAAAVAATLVPARRASRVDPIGALRE
jgi:ABC-type antimicrobial peptide transport system permease subunit